MPLGKNAWQLLTFDLLIKIEILHALLAVSMTSILLVVFIMGTTPYLLTIFITDYR